MSKFKYLAYHPNGSRLSSVVAATTPEQAKQMLWADGLYVVNIQRDFAYPKLEELFPSFVKVRRSEVILFTRQLATFVKVGMPILDGLAVLRDQAASRLMLEALTEMMTDLGTGASLSAAMSRFPRIFSPLYVDMIRSAEVSGNLDDTLRQLAEYMSRDESALRKVRNAMIYPSIVLTLAVVVIFVLIGFVLPAFAHLFSDFHSQMPGPTRVLLAVGEFCHAYTVPILVGVAAIVVGLVVYFRTTRGQQVRDMALLWIPVLRTILRYAVIERYLRTMSTLARAGVPITEMLDTANQALGNHVFQRGLASVRDQMLSGDGFALPMERTGLFPRMVIQMVKVGEETGNLDSNLETAAEHYAEEVDFRIKRMIAIMEPALVIVVGVMVGFIAISVIAPMYALVSAIK